MHHIEDMKRRLKALTLRLDSTIFRRLVTAASAENRTPTNYIETLVLRELAAKDGANRIITVYAPPETATLVPGDLERGAEETEQRYARRKKIVDELMSIPDED
jgi:hypothetical protein